MKRAATIGRIILLAACILFFLLLILFASGITGDFRQICSAVLTVLAYTTPLGVLACIISWLFHRKGPNSTAKVVGRLNIAVFGGACACIVAFVALSYVTVIPIYSPEICIAVLLQSEPVGAHEIDAMMAANQNTPAQATLSADGREFTIPLPDGAVQFANGAYPLPKNGHQYLVRVSSYQVYEDEMWASNQMTEQMGSGFTLQDPKTGTSYQLHIRMFTRYYMLISYPPQST